MPSMTDVDFIIVGQGLAGTCLAWELLALGASVRVIDREAAVTSSRIAAGLITPVTGQRLVKTWRFEELRDAAWEFYRRVESDLGCEVLRDTSMVKVFTSVSERESFDKRMHDPAYAGLLREMTECPAGVSAPRGGCELLRGGQLDVAEFLAQSRQRWIREGMYLAADVSWPGDVRFIQEGAASGPVSPAIDADDKLDDIAGEKMRVRGPHASSRPPTPPPPPGPLPHSRVYPDIRVDCGGEGAEFGDTLLGGIVFIDPVWPLRSSRRTATLGPAGQHSHLLRGVRRPLQSVVLKRRIQPRARRDADCRDPALE